MLDHFNELRTFKRIAAHASLSSPRSGPGRCNASCRDGAAPRPPSLR